MDSSSLNFLTSFVFFAAVYLVAYFIIFRNWGPKHRSEASSSFMSLSHGTPAVILSIHALLLSSSSSFESLNSPAENAVLEFSAAYFVADLLHYLIFSPADALLFVLHHLATLYVFLTSRCLVGRGAYGLLELLILAEATSACQNAWSISRFRKDESPAASKLYEFLSPPFYVFYFVVRGVLGPVFVAQMVGFFAGGEAEGLIPAWVWGSWMVVIVSAILVSVLWVMGHWVGWCKEKGVLGFDLKEEKMKMKVK
ncbi:TLC domain-containing protein At5g14285 [Linum grandiflorum]